VAEEGFNGAAAGRPRKGPPQVLVTLDARASMGPRPVGRGRHGLGSGIDSQLLASMGPRPVGRGRHFRCTSPKRRVHASMGPRPVGRGREKVKELAGALKGASMGPRPVGRGRDVSDDPRCEARCASMGPRPVGRGRGNDKTVRSSWICFNGAAAGRPRKVEYTPDIGVWLVASMGPRPVGRGRHAEANGRTQINWLQWGRGRSAAEGRSPRTRLRCPQCFNGAAAGRPRKGPGHRLISGDYSASMGPRPVGRGRVPRCVGCYRDV